jgi:outer membrane lipoprotein-sorting protein
MYRFLFCFLVLVEGTAYAQGVFTAVSDVSAFKNEFAIQSKKINTISSDFIQEKTLTLLTEKIISKGKFWFKRSDKVKIEYKTPYVYTMIINGDQMISKDGSKETHMNVSSNKMFRQLNKIIIDCVQGTILYNKDFSVKVFESASLYRIQLTPSTKMIKEFFQTILVHIDKKDYSVSIIELNEQGGDTTVMRFTNKQFNNSLGDAVFTLQ